MFVYCESQHYYTFLPAPFELEEQFLALARLFHLGYDSATSIVVKDNFLHNSIFTESAHWADSV